MLPVNFFAQAVIAKRLGNSCTSLFPARHRTSLLEPQTIPVHKSNDGSHGTMVALMSSGSIIVDGGALRDIPRSVNSAAL